MVPLFLPEGMSIDTLLRAQVAIILFAAAHPAEVVRGGPQALRLVIPPLVNTFIGMFKDTSLVLIIGIFDLLNTAKTAIIEPAWQGFGIEACLFVSAIYFVFCFAMSKYSQGIETELNRHRRR